MKQLLIAAALIAAATAAPIAAPAAAQVRDRPVLTLDGARIVILAAEAEAVRRNLKVTISVVDFAGVPIAMSRMDDASLVGAEISLAKARTAAGFNNNTGVYEQRLQKEGQTRLLTLPVVASDGGYPIRAGGRTAGAVGVSGATSEEDGLIAKAGIAALEAALGAKK
ncbi:GlcG/HbpS family heme-binding protein [Sandarakinorhabdus rubra]|uniref:GlcG/HbpS family heme-binding protein n=1 Tax=Sandarakinorhabdus rubra TaxID=2672568 RepID=UPI0013DD6161|nr:heme-binding protein [Sandarakinorhabdus rubra]